MWREFSLLQRRSSCGRHIDVATAPNIFCSWSLLVAWNLRKKSFKSFWQLIFFSRPQNQTRSTNKRHRIPTLWRSARDFGQRKNTLTNIHLSIINVEIFRVKIWLKRMAVLNWLARGLKQGHVKTLMSLFCRHFSKRRDSVLPNCNVALIKQQRGDAV